MIRQAVQYYSPCTSTQELAHTHCTQWATVLFWLHAPKHTLHMLVLMHYTSQQREEQDMVVPENYT